MKPGDLVRFAKWEELSAEEIQHSNRHQQRETLLLELMQESITKEMEIH